MMGLLQIKRTGILLCAVFALMPAFASAEDVKAEPKKETSWTDYVTRFIPFWEKDSAEKDSGKEKKAPEKEKKSSGKKTSPKAASSIYTDYLPDDLPGIAEYRMAIRCQQREVRPERNEQEVFDLYEASAQKGNVLALMKQYQMFEENPETTEEGRTFFADRLNFACHEVYPAAVAGSPDAQYYYARYCVNVKTPQAQSWFVRVLKQYRPYADKDEPYAQYMLGDIYHLVGEEKKGQDWFIRSAKNGNSEAVCRIKPQNFHEQKLWEKLPDSVKGNSSCAVYQGLKIIFKTHSNKAVVHAAGRMLSEMQQGYAQRGFTAAGYRFTGAARELEELLSGPLPEVTEAQAEKSAALIEKYKGDKAAFIDDYLDKFDWDRLKPFGR